MKLWPRLPRPAAAAKFAAMDSLALAALTEMADLSDPAQTFASTGGDRATPSDLAGLRALVLEVAQAHGYPDPGNFTAFDRTLAPLLHAEMSITYGEALNREIWSFTSLVLAPDVTAWRFNTRTQERWVCVDRTRQMFSRLWWQQNQLGAKGPGGGTLLDEFKESELNQLLERTAIGGCRPLVEALARGVLALPEDQRKRAVVRDVPLHLLRMSTLIDPHAVGADVLDDLVSMAVDLSTR